MWQPLQPVLLLLYDMGEQAYRVLPIVLMPGISTLRPHTQHARASVGNAGLDTSPVFNDSLEYRDWLRCWQESYLRLWTFAILPPLQAVAPSAPLGSDGVISPVGRKRAREERGECWGKQLVGGHGGDMQRGLRVAYGTLGCAGSWSAQQRSKSPQRYPPVCPLN